MAELNEAGGVHLDWKRGNPWSATFRVMGMAGLVSTAKMQVRPHAGHPTALITFNSAGGGTSGTTATITDDDGDALIKLAFDTAASLLLNFDKGEWDIRATVDGLEKVIVPTGTVKLEQQVTT